MPYASQAQARKFHSDPKLRKYAAEWDAATPDIKKLPQYVPNSTAHFHPKHKAKLAK